MFARGDAVEIPGVFMRAEIGNCVNGTSCILYFPRSDSYCDFTDSPPRELLCNEKYMFFFLFLFDKTNAARQALH